MVERLHFQQKVSGSIPDLKMRLDFYKNILYNIFVR